MVQLLVGFEERGVVGMWEGNIHVHDIVICYLQEVTPNAWGRLTTPTYPECSGRCCLTIAIAIGRGLASLLEFGVAARLSTICWRFVVFYFNQSVRLGDMLFKQICLCVGFTGLLNVHDSCSGLYS